MTLEIRRRLEAARKERHRDVDLLRKYYERDADDRAEPGLDDRTWQDLDMDEVFFALDHASSEPGRQVLYDMLRTPHDSAESLQELERGVQCLSDQATAESIRAAVSPLADRGSAYFVDLLYGEPPARPLLWWLFPALTVASVGCLALAVLWPRALLVWIVVCIANICAQLAYKPRVKRFIPAILQLPKVLRAAAALGSIAAPELAHEAAMFRRGTAEIRALRPAANWLRFESDQTDPLLLSLYEYVNLLFLLDVTAFVLTFETIRKSRSTLRAMFASLGRLDALDAIARWRETLGVWTTPTFTQPAKALDTVDLAHPLLDAPVRNPLQLDGRSLLVTGSNMSGKTTFVLALGVNAVLAQTLHTVCASRWEAPPLSVRTFIGRADSLMEGKSYYLAEAESILALIRAKRDGVQHLFLLDEIFRGTNTTERIAAASAVLAYLNRRNDLVVVATHDLEMLELLGHSYDAMHFAEQVDANGLTFDYRIRPGPSSTRNAIALLELMGYPKDLIADALATLGWAAR